VSDTSGVERMIIDDIRAEVTRRLACPACGCPRVLGPDDELWCPICPTNGQWAEPQGIRP
jgi:hypothetical protein